MTTITENDFRAGFADSERDATGIQDDLGKARGSESTVTIEYPSPASEQGLLPCPKCGSTDLLLRDVGGWELDCRDCELNLVLANDPSREGLIAAWNTRTPPQLGSQEDKNQG